MEGRIDGNASLDYATIQIFPVQNRLDGVSVAILFSNFEVEVFSVSSMAKPDFKYNCYVVCLLKNKVI